MSKHTPGPWRVDPKRSMRVTSIGDETICSCGGSDLIRESWESNALLIAAAPDLLEALERFAPFAEAVIAFSEKGRTFPKTGTVYALDGYGLGEREIDVEDFRECLAAIAKAKGKA